MTSVTVTSTFQNGWADLFFAGVNATLTGLVSDAGNTVTSTLNGGGALVTTVGAQTFRGLPVVGFMIRTFANNTLTCGTATCQGNYGGSVSHAYRNSITP